MNPLLPFYDLQPKWATEQEMRFARNEAPRRLPLLADELRLLASNPRHPGQHREPNGLGAYMFRGGHPNMSFGWVTADMQILDFLAHDLDINAADLRDLSIQFGS